MSKKTLRQPPTLVSLCQDPLLKRLVNVRFVTVDDVDAIASIYHQLPKTCLQDLRNKIEIREDWIALLRNKETLFKGRIWLPVYYLLRCFSPALSQQFVSIYVDDLRAFRLLSQWKEEWENMTKVTIYLGNMYLRDEFEFLCDNLGHVTHLQMKYAYWRPHPQRNKHGKKLVFFQDLDWIHLFSCMINLKVVSFLGGDPRLLNNFVQGQKGSNNLVHLEYKPNCWALATFRDDYTDIGLLINELKSIKILDIQHNVWLSCSSANPTGNDDPPQLEELRLSNKYNRCSCPCCRNRHPSLLDPSVIENTGLVNLFLKRCEAQFPKLNTVYADGYTFVNFKDLYKGSWNLLSRLEIIVNCLEFADIVQKIGTQMPKLKHLIVASEMEEKILEDSEEIEAIQTLCNIDTVCLKLAKVSHLCLKAALGLSNVKTLEFSAKRFTQMNPLILRDCFKNRKVQHFKCILAYKYTTKSERKMWKDCKIFCLSPNDSICF